MISGLSNFLFSWRRDSNYFLKLEQIFWRSLAGWRRFCSESKSREAQRESYSHGCDTYKHGRPILERTGYTWNPSVVRQPSVAVAWWQGRVEEGLLSGVMSLSLVLLRLG